MTTARDAAQEAVHLTDALAQHISADDSLASIWARPEGEVALRLLRDRGYAPDEFLEASEGYDLNFQMPDWVGRFYDAYSRQIRASLCSAEGDLRGTVATAIGSGTASLLASLAAVLTVPAAAVPLLVPIAAILLVKGIDAFCEVADGSEVQSK